MSTTKIGKAKYGAGKKTYYKLKDGDSTYRILPPLGDLADEGVWSLYYRVVYGYTNTAGKSRAFESSLVKNFKTKMVEVPDAAVERIDKLKAALENAKAKKDKKTVENLQKLVGAPKSRYNVDSNHYMNVMDLQGNIGILKLRHKAKQALDVQIRKLRDKGVDPLSVDNGRFFVFTRTGTGNETQFAVAVYGIEQEIENVGTVPVPVISKLNEEVISRLGSEAGELQKLFKKPTAEQIQQLVEESDLATGVSPNIDDILGYKKEEAAVADTDEDANEESATVQATEADQDITSYIGSQTENTAQAAEPAPAAKAAPAPAAKVETKTTTATTATKKAAPATAPQTTADKVADMSDDEFLKSLGIN